MFVWNVAALGTTRLCRHAESSSRRTGKKPKRERQALNRARLKNGKWLSSEKTSLRNKLAWHAGLLIATFLFISLTTAHSTASLSRQWVLADAQWSKHARLSRASSRSFSIAIEHQFQTDMCYFFFSVLVYVWWTGSFSSSPEALFRSENWLQWNETKKKTGKEKQSSQPNIVQKFSLLVLFSFYCQKSLHFRVFRFLIQQWGSIRAAASMPV